MRNFIQTNNETLININEVRSINDDGVVFLKDGGKEHIGWDGHQDLACELGFIPAAGNQQAVVFIRGECYVVPVVAWNVDRVLGAVGVLPIQVTANMEGRRPDGLLIGEKVFSEDGVFESLAAFAAFHRGEAS